MLGFFTRFSRLTNLNIGSYEFSMLGLLKKRKTLLFQFLFQRANPLNSAYIRPEFRLQTPSSEFTPKKCD